MSGELKACPLCTGPATFERIGTQRQSCIVRCDDCGLKLETGEEGSMCGQSWNARPTPAPGALPELPEACEFLTTRQRMYGLRSDEFCNVDELAGKDYYSADQMHAYARAYAERCHAGVWLPIESAPKDGSSILVTGGEWFSDDGNYVFRLDIVVIATWMYDKWFIGAGYAHDVNHWAEPTHWMPLPAPPALQSAFADDEGVKRGD